MKYVLILGDGMSDEPLEELGGKTPLAFADTPNMDAISKLSEVGMSQTIPDGMNPGSDTANLAVLGYNPRKYYTGRSPLEALSIGVNMEDTDIALRCNFVTVSDDLLPYEEKTIVDHSSGEISTEEASILLEAIKKELEDERYQFYVGTSYRHLTIWKNGSVVDLVAPHDILENCIKEFLPKEAALKEMMKKSYDILNHHPINEDRALKGLNKANSIWFWGAGTRPTFDSFESKYHKTGVMISAVDLLKGIAVGSGLKNIKVEGADGTLHTNYKGKALAAVDALLKGGYDFAYIHVEAPDEMGHQGSIPKKIEAIESLDKKVIQVVKEEMDQSGEPYRMLVMPDHPTPIAKRTHTSDPVPFMLYDSENERNENWNYTEEDGKKSGVVIKEGYTLIDKLFSQGNLFN